MPKIFISYRRADSAMLATHLAVMLKSQHDIDSFVDTRSIDGGGPFPNRLYRAIEECDVFVCLLGATTLDSEWVRKEIQHANTLRKVLIPVFQERYIAPEPISDDHVDALLQSDGVHILDVRNLYIEAAIARLAEMILNTSLNPPPSPVLGIRGELKAVKIEASVPAIGISDVSDAIHFTESESVRKIPDLSTYNAAVLKILPPPFEWCFVPSGNVTLETDPPKTYSIPDFAIAKYTITNAQFQVFVEARNGYMYEDHYGWYNFSNEARTYRSRNPKPKTVAFSGDDIPRTNLTWFDAVAFCKWLNNNIGQSVSLPTEQQWQRAAIGDTGWAFPWGNEFDASRCDARESGVEKLASVSEYPTGISSYGVFNMIGSVWEWCSTDYDNPDFSNISVAANRRVMRGGSLNDVVRNLRGGAWDGYPSLLRAAFRHGSASDNRDSGVGFRCVIDVHNF